MTLELSGSVGLNGRNDPTDVQSVKQRLDLLGFNFFGPLDGQVNTGFIMAIKLFQSIIAGRARVSGDGRIDVNFGTHQFLKAANAPQWQLMPLKGAGFINYERQDTSDHHDYGTDWIANVIRDAAARYQDHYRAQHPSSAPLGINDVSLPHGGDTPDHAGHETGLSCDILLPHVDGQLGKITWRDGQYDQAAMRAMLNAIRQQPLVSAVFFNDPQLVREGLCSSLRGHDNHAHFNISPPAIDDTM